jgi:hypothetical protein
MQFIDRIGADNLPDDGVDVAGIANGIKVDLGQVQEEISNLLAEGLVYTTSDEDQ